MSEQDKDLDDLESAEDFLDYFDVCYEEHVVKVNRLHILQRFHDYLNRHDITLTETTEEEYRLCRQLIKKAYTDFVQSSAAEEKVFKVFRRQDPREVFIPVDRIGR